MIMSQGQALIGHIDKYDSEERYIGTTVDEVSYALSGRSNLAAETCNIRTMEEVFIGRDPNRW